MKKQFLLSVSLVFLLHSCTTVYLSQSYEDANYLTDKEFQNYDDYTNVNEINIDTNNSFSTDTSEDGSVINNYYGDYYEADDYYDFSYSARIRRFHQPMWSYGYYGGLYTDYYWYSHNPYHCGSSIYFGYGNYDPFYSSYYSWGCYNYYPYYTYYSPYYYDYHHHYGNYYNTPTLVSYTPNNYHYGPRGSLSSGNNVVRPLNGTVKATPHVDNQTTNRVITTKSTEPTISNFGHTNRNTQQIEDGKQKGERSINSNTRSQNNHNNHQENYRTNRTSSTPNTTPNRSFNNSRSQSSGNGSSNHRSSSENSNRKINPRR